MGLKSIKVSSSFFISITIFKLKASIKKIFYTLPYLALGISCLSSPNAFAGLTFSKTKQHQSDEPCGPKSGVKDPSAPDLTPFDSLLTPKQSMQVYGHRGGSATAPENSRSSILEAFRLGAHGAEFDLQLTKDHQVIVLHDDTLERTAGPYDPQLFPELNKEQYKKMLKTPVQKLTFSQLRQVDIGHWQGPQFRGEKIITLEDALDLLPPNKEYLIEVKGDDFAIIPHLKRILKNYLAQNPERNPHSLKIIGFGYEVMKKVKEEMPEFMIFQVLNDDQAADPKKLKQIVSKAKEANLDGLDLKATKHVTKKLVGDLKKEGKKVIVWVWGKDHKIIDTAVNAQRLEDAGVDIFTSNIPKSIAQWLNSKN